MQSCHVSLSEQLNADAKRHDATSKLSPRHMMCITHLYVALIDKVALCRNHAIGTDNHKLQ